MNLTGLYVQKRIIIYWHIFQSSGFHHICNIKYRLNCRCSPQNILNAQNFNPHKKPISLLNVPICTQGMQRTWWPEAGTIIVTGPYSHLLYHMVMFALFHLNCKSYRPYILTRHNLLPCTHIYDKNWCQDLQTCLVVIQLPKMYAAQKPKAWWLIWNAIEQSSWLQWGLLSSVC